MQSLLSWKQTIMQHAWNIGMQCLFIYVGQALNCGTGGAWHRLCWYVCILRYCLNTCHHNSSFSFGRWCEKPWKELESLPPQYIYNLIIAHDMSNIVCLCICLFKWRLLLFASYKIVDNYLYLVYICKLNSISLYYKLYYTILYLICVTFILHRILSYLLHA